MGMNTATRASDEWGGWIVDVGWLVPGRDLVRAIAFPVDISFCTVGVPWWW
jgi:hypothetical protein